MGCSFVFDNRSWISTSDSTCHSWNSWLEHAESLWYWFLPTLGPRYDINSSGLVLLMKLIAEYRPLIRSVIAEIIDSLSHSDDAIRGQYTLLKLSQQGKVVKFPVLAFAHNHHSRIAIFNWPSHSCDYRLTQGQPLWHSCGLCKCSVDILGTW